MTGDQADIFARLSERIPKGWFGSFHPLLDAILRGVSNALSAVYSAYAYMVLQTRLQTSTDGWLDLLAADYFGPNGLPRNPGESDSAYRNRIKINIIRERGTRAAVVKILTDLTGRAPTIIEPQRPADTGVYGGPLIGYGVAGSYGSRMLAYQAFVTAYRPLGSGIPNVGGYGTSVGGYSRGSQLEYANISSSQTGITDAQIYAAVASVIPVATIAWMRIQN